MLNMLHLLEENNEITRSPPPPFPFYLVQKFWMLLAIVTFRNFPVRSKSTVFILSGLYFFVREFYFQYGGGEALKYDLRASSHREQLPFQMRFMVPVFEFNL